MGGKTSLQSARGGHFRPMAGRDFEKGTLAARVRALKGEARTLKCFIRVFLPCLLLLLTSFAGGGWREVAF